MPVDIIVGSNHLYTNGSRIKGLPQASANGEAVTFEQLNAAIEGIKWKAARVASTANVNLAAPGAAMDGVTLANGDIVLLKNQTTQPENGPYAFSGAASPLVRAANSSTGDEIEGEVVSISEGTANAGTQWRQTTQNPVIGTNNIVYTSFGSAAPPASESTAGVVELATQAEVDAGTIDSMAVTPLKLATSPYAVKVFKATIGDGTASDYNLTHNFNTEDLTVRFREATGAKRGMALGWQPNGLNGITVGANGAIALNSVRVMIMRA